MLGCVTRGLGLGGVCPRTHWARLIPGPNGGICASPGQLGECRRRGQMARDREKGPGSPFPPVGASQPLEEAASRHQESFLGGPDASAPPPSPHRLVSRESTGRKPSSARRRDRLSFSDVAPRQQEPHVHEAASILRLRQQNLSIGHNPQPGCTPHTLGGGAPASRRLFHTLRHAARRHIRVFTVDIYIYTYSCA